MTEPTTPGLWRFDWILDDLAVGAAPARGSAAELARVHEIGAIIDVRLESNGEAEELAACGLPSLRLPTEDHCAVSQAMLDRGVRFARQVAARRRKLLVHCQHGIGRAPLVALCILVDRGFAPLEALSRTKDSREVVSPSPAQYAAWAAWQRRRGLRGEVPSFEAFAAIAYRHLPRSA